MFLSHHFCHFSCAYSEVLDSGWCHWRRNRGYFRGLRWCSHFSCLRTLSLWPSPPFTGAHTYVVAYSPLPLSSFCGIRELSSLLGRTAPPRAEALGLSALISEEHSVWMSSMITGLSCVVFQRRKGLCVLNSEVGNIAARACYSFNGCSYDLTWPYWNQSWFSKKEKEPPNPTWQLTRRRDRDMFYFSGLKHHLCSGNNFLLHFVLLGSNHNMSFSSLLSGWQVFLKDLCLLLAFDALLDRRQKKLVSPTNTMSVMDSEGVGTQAPWVGTHKLCITGSQQLLL